MWKYETHFGRIREQDPLKQGLKLTCKESQVQGIEIREQDPLKQGLKQALAAALVADCINSRARSIKTRIETYFHRPHRGRAPGIREQDPLKQGLKLQPKTRAASSLSYSRARSIKTRIETYLVGAPLDQDKIREQDPLKQGLKLGSAESLRAATTIREQDPLKQGLKPNTTTARPATQRFASKIH